MFNKNVKNSVLISVFFGSVQFVKVDTNLYLIAKIVIFFSQPISIKSSKVLPQRIDFYPGKVGPQCVPKQMPASRFVISIIISRPVFVKYPASSFIQSSLAFSPTV